MLTVINFFKFFFQIRDFVLISVSLFSVFKVWIFIEAQTIFTITECSVLRKLTNSDIEQFYLIFS